MLRSLRRLLGFGLIHQVEQLGGALGIGVAAGRGLVGRK
jgi:hypothetical protein